MVHHVACLDLNASGRRAGRYVTGAVITRAPRVGTWHAIADGPDLGARLPPQPHFLTILSYRLGPDGSPAHYNGPLYGECDTADPAQAFADFRRCLELLHIDYGCPLEAIHAWHSGRRGPHWTIPPVVIGAEAGHPQLPRIYAAMVQQLFPPSVAPTLDRSVYSAGKGRMWRVPNRRRSDNGRYKVPLAMREVLHKPSTELEALTHRPRKGLFWLSEEELSPCPALVELYHQVRASMEQAAGKPLVRHHVRDGGGTVWRLVERCAVIRHSREHAATLSEPEWYAMISNVARCADGPAAVHRLSAPYPGSGVTQGFVAVPEREAPPKALGNRAGA